MGARIPVGRITVARLYALTLTNTIVRPVRHDPGAISVPVTITGVGACISVGNAEAVPVGMAIVALQRIKSAVENTHSALRPTTRRRRHTVATKGDIAQITVLLVLATVAAAIAVVGVAVIADFDAGAQMSITTTRRRAGVQTGVGVAGIGVVAGLNTGAHMAVAATRCHTGR